MGIYDRDYFQDESATRGFHIGAEPRMLVTNIVIATFVVFVVDIFATGALSDVLGLYVNFYVRPWQVYQLLTYGFVHAGVWHIAMNMFILWMFGRFVEQRLGRREFLLFYLAAVIFSGIVWAGAINVWLLSSDAGQLTLEQINQLQAFSEENPPAVGASGGVVAVFILFVLFYPRMTVYVFALWPVPAWVVGLFVVGFELLRAVGGPAGGKVAWQAHLGGAAFAFLYLKLGWNFSRLLPGGGPSSWKPRRKGPRLRVHRPDDDLEKLASEADRILAKLHREGESSLTGRERRTLEEYSRRVRQGR
jgi:membrane associated rhomboid family serine protease